MVWVVRKNMLGQVLKRKREGDFPSLRYRPHLVGQGATKSKAQKPFPTQHTLMATFSRIDRQKQHPHAVGKKQSKPHKYVQHQIGCQLIWKQKLRGQVD